MVCGIFLQDTTSTLRRVCWPLGTRHGCWVNITLPHISASHSGTTCLEQVRNPPFTRMEYTLTKWWAAFSGISHCKDRGFWSAEYGTLPVCVFENLILKAHMEHDSECIFYNFQKKIYFFIYFIIWDELLTPVDLTWLDLTWLENISGLTRLDSVSIW